MNYKFLTLFAVGIMAAALSADVLYWQVNSSDVPTTKGTAAQAYLMASADNAKSPFYVSENYLGGVNQGESVAVGSFNGSTLAAGTLDLAKILSWSDDTVSAESLGLGLSALSFYVELYDAAGNWVSNTDPVSYNTLLSNGAIATGSFNPSFTGVNSALGSAGTTYHDVPEPTSGLLMLVGLGALALRRRKVA